MPLNPRTFKSFRTLLRKAAYGSRIIFRTLLRKAMIMGLCPKPYKTLTVQNFALQSGYATASYSELCFAKRSSTAAFIFAVHWSKHFATQNGLRPPRFLRGAYFAVHKRFDLNFIKIILANDFLDNIVFKFCINLNSRHFQNCVKTEQHSCEG